MKARRWIQIEFELSEAHQDLVIGQLAALGCEGFTQEGTSLHAFLPFQLWDAGFQARLDQVLAAFAASFPQAQTTYSTSTVAEENWNKRWEASAGIVEATDRIVIKPSWKKLRKKDRGKIVLHIDPKMSFGTGHHETTRLCLSLLEQYVERGMTVLDFGCGTGILAIAAVKLKARRSDAVDVDEWSVLNARENVRRNRCSEKIIVRLGDVRKIPRKRYDLIVSNTDVPTLTASLPTLVTVLRPGKPLLISGLMTSDLESFHAMATRLELRVLEVLSENEWAAVSLVGPDAPRRN